METIFFELPWLGIRVRPAETSVQLAMLTTVVLSVVFARWLEKLDTRRVLGVMLVLAIAVLVGGRLHYLITSWRAYSGRPLDVLAIWRGQFHIPGGIIALALATPFVCRRFGIPTGKLADAMAVAVGAGIVVARVGCWLETCCYGDFCQGPWCVTFPRQSQAFEMHWRTGHIARDAASSLPVHPLQLYFAAVGIVIAVGSLLLSRVKRYDGQVALWAMLVFSSTSFGLEFLRNDFPPRRYWGSLPQLAWTTGAMTMVSLLAVMVFEWRHRRAVTRPAAAASVVIP